MSRIKISELQEKYKKWSANNCNIIYTAPKEVFEFMKQFIEVRDRGIRQRILELIDEVYEKEKKKILALIKEEPEFKDRGLAGIGLLVIFKDELKQKIEEGK